MIRTTGPVWSPCIAVAAMLGCAAGVPRTSVTDVVDVPPTGAVWKTRGLEVADLRRHLEALAHDSMMGREAGTLGNARATDYIAAEIARLGLVPAGENGSWFQAIPFGALASDTAGVITAGGVPLHVGDDVVPIPSVGGLLPFDDARSLEGIVAVFGGRLRTGPATLGAEQIRGKLIVFDAPQTDDGRPIFNFATPSLLEALGQYRQAAGIAVATLDITPARMIALLGDYNETMLDPDDPSPNRPLGLLVTRAAARRLMGGSIDSMTIGTVGVIVHGGIAPRFRPAEHPARNVIGILEGSDPNLRGEYVALVAHSDHDGLAAQPVNHDSALAYNTVLRPWGADSAARPQSPERAARVEMIRDSLRDVSVGRLDSIFNGADDDGSGSVALLGIARALARTPTRPRRSLLFVWHTAEEKGILGAKYFVNHPTVPRESIVAALNLDMIGRGGAGDLPGGGPAYLQLVGSRRLSTELGDLVERLNHEDGHGFRFDYQFDAPGHPHQYYCRGDHIEYARYGIPVVFFSTGSHRDYHMVTDEAAYIDYEKLAAVSALVLDVALELADLDHRVALDRPQPDPWAPCHQ